MLSHTLVITYTRYHIRLLSHTLVITYACYHIHSLSHTIGLQHNSKTFLNDPCKQFIEYGCF